MLLNYEDRGPGPVVVLIHGFPLDHTMWNYQIETVGSIYRVIAPDLRGHGQSAAPEGVYTIGAMAGDVIETLDALGITQPVVIGGMSMGGYIALDLAVNHPDRVRGLMLVNTRAAADTPQAAQAREDMAREVEAAGTVEPVVATTHPRLFAPNAGRRHAARMAAAREQMSATVPRAVAGALLGMAARVDRTADLVRINVPTLVIAGAEDQVIPLAESEAMAQALPNASLVVVPGAGHMAPVEEPIAVNEAMLAFLGTLA